MAKKNASLIGEDGRLYFKYAVGAVYEYRPPAGRKIVQKIVDCAYINGKEYYALESNGELLFTKYPVERLEKLLTMVAYEQTEEGEYRELPLLVEEVEEYFAEKERELNYANAQANKELKGTEYYKLLSKSASLRKCLMLALAEEREEDSEKYEQQLNETLEKIDKILSEKRISVTILRKIPECAICKDTGIVEGNICVCAKMRAEQIKAYNAALRLTEED